MQVIHDPIHGTIKICEKAKAVINHPGFQRLRRVKALGFLDRVFPGAKHSRFEHSIGAYHIAKLLINSIKKVHEEVRMKNQGCLENSEFIILNEQELEDILSPLQDYVAIAALLHDVGHGPFSHASESVMPEIDKLVEENKEGSSNFVIEALRNKKKHNLKKKKKTKADHEDYSLLIMDKILRDLKWTKNEIQLVSALKYEHVEVPESFSKTTVSLLRLLVDGELDSDRMDYLLRDSHFCGVPYGKYDLNRLRDGLCIVKHQSKGFYQFGIMRKSLSAFEDFLFSRYQMHVQVYSHRTDANCNKIFDVLCSREEKPYELPPNVDKYLLVDDESFIHQDNVPKELIEVIRERKLWYLGFESFGNDKSLEQVIENKFKKSIDDGFYAIYTSEKAIKKPSLLDFPIICKSFVRKKLVSDNMKSISDLIAHYNGSFSVRRIFYHPKFKDVVDKIYEEVSRAAIVDMIQETKQDLENLSENDEAISPKAVDKN